MQSFSQEGFIDIHNIHFICKTELHWLWKLLTETLIFQNKNIHFWDQPKINYNNVPKWKQPTRSSDLHSGIFIQMGEQVFIMAIAWINYQKANMWGFFFSSSKLFIHTILTTLFAGKYSKKAIIYFLISCFYHKHISLRLKIWR